ncbi:hypothetical protein ACRYCC_34140 [Actinomadura scrupuli]|uniref:hypothetical protein n=1 Tax=Actinomadura scrupuli TaxID=559629 RepID=UPI003D96624D
MAVTLNKQALQHAQGLVKEHKVVADDRDDWSEHQPTAQAENDHLEEHGFAEYQKWYLGIDDEHGEETKSRYKFPYGDFEKVHRCGLIAVEVRAAQNDYTDIEQAAKHLREMLDESA